MNKGGGSKARPERSKIDQQTLEDILRSPDDSSDEDIQKERQTETFTNELKNRLQQTKAATGQTTYTFSQNLNQYELSDSSSEEENDEREVAEAVQGITKPQQMQSSLANSTRFDFLKENIHNPDARAALISAMSSGDDSDGSNSSDDKTKAYRPKEDSLQRMASQVTEPKVIQRTDVLATIELNEKQNDMMSDKLAEQAGQLLSFKKEYYDLNKQLIMQSQFAQIQEKLFDQPDHKYYGVVSCINLFRNFIFIGNSTGYIRVFDIKSQKEMKPLYDEQVASNKVTSIDITEDGHYLLSGYKKGTVVLWDANKYKLARMMPDIAKSEITAAKILYVTQEGTVNIVVAEDVGRIRLVEIFKGNFFGGYNHNVIPLYEERLIGASTISVCNPSNLPGYESKFCSAACLVAFGASNQVVLCSMRPIKELLCIKPSKYNRKRSIPYVDWGYGLTPTIREKTMPLMAVAWDRMIQLVYVNDQTNEIQMDGYYCCDEEINQVYFMGDSILVVLVNMKELKILYTTKFQPGDYKYLDVESGKDDLYQSVFKEAVQGSRHCEIWNGLDFADIRRGVIAINNNKQQFFNFNNTITKFQKSIVFAGNKTLTKARLLSWREYIEKLKFSDNYDWLTVLKAALEIYNGELRGFALLPDEKERREEYLKDYMKKLIMTSIQTVLYKFQKVSETPKSESDEDSKSYSIEDIAIKVSIEFCLNINETQFLFSEVFDFFRENGLRENFISLLCPPIVAGQFRKEYIPEHILEKIIIYLEAKQNYKVLEKIIQQLDLSKYSENAPNKGVSMRAVLEVLCSTNCMVSALLYLYTSQATGDAGCKQILEMMHKNMCDKKSQEDIDRKRNPQLRQIVKEDIRNMQSVDRDRRYHLEKSYLYTGYKLLWIIKMFLEGKKFPYGSLTTQQWQQHTFQIIDFLMSDKYLNDVFILDPEMFFKVMAKLFCGQPWKFFSYWRNTHPSSVDPWDFFMKLETEALRTSRLDQNAKTIDAFYDFVLNVLVTQHNEKAEILQKEDEMATNFQIYRLASEYKFLDIEQKVVVQAVLNAFESKESQTDVDFVTDPKLIQKVITGSECPVNENLIIETLNARKFAESDIDKILAKMVEIKHPLTTIKIKLYEKKKDYVEAFELHFSNPLLKKKVFNWLEVTMQVLHDDEILFQETMKSENAATYEPLQKLKSCIRKRMVELAQMSCKKTRIMICKWFDEGQYQQQLILNELAGKPDIQFEYLLSYVTDNEKEISETIKESVYQPERQKQAQLFTTFLVRFTRLLCEFQKGQVEKWVKREYFPVSECLEVCRAMKNERGEAVLLKREGQYLPAIHQYLSMIEKLDVAVLVDNLCRVEPNKETVSSEAWEFGTVAAFNTGLGSFDENLEKACKIAEKKENGFNVTGDDGWFAILGFLQNFSVMASIKINEVMQRAEKKRSLFDRAAAIPKETHVERLKDFVNRRINYILKKPTLEISLKIIMDKLELKFLQVQRLYNHKIALMNEEMKFEVYAERILQHDVNTLFFENKIQKVSAPFDDLVQGTGAICNPLDRPVVMSQGKRVTLAGDATQMCQHCRLALVGTKQVVAQNIIVFNACGHQYHQNCLAQLETIDVCAKCERFVLQEVSKSDSGKDKQSKSPTKKKPVSEGSAAQADTIESSKKRSLNLVMRTLENFDMQTEQQMLTSVDFATK